nr:extracellular matrix-binding protein ebh isoform X2 [Osmia lignaria]
MRERTPSADDNPRRAPPAPLREAAPADVTGSKTSSEPVRRGPNFSPATTASSTSASSPSPCVDARMVASTHNLDELTVSHPTSASSDRQQQQEKHGPAYRSAQTAQDKRSRLSNVINNLRKKVPDSRNGDSPRKEEDDRNSVERNLETLEKYVMTVLNGVIKDEEEEDGEVGRKKEEKGKDPEKMTEEQEDEDSKGPAAKFEPSKPNESRTEAAVFSSKQPEKPEAKEPMGHRKSETRESDVLQKEEKVSSISKEPTDGFREENQALKVEAAEDKCSSRETKPEDDSVQESTRTDAQEEERKENRSLGTIIMERLSEHQTEEKGSIEAAKEQAREFVPENVELRNVCRDLLNDLLNGINQLIDEKSQATEDSRPVEGSVEESKDSRSPDLSTTSLHCSLPLDKVASVLQNCQSNELVAPQSPSSSSSSSSSQGSKSPSKPTSPTVRHLCLYCDRKFLSISLRQRHTERVHQQGGGRRSERNSRRPSQNCQYCSDKCAESLESLFQHMVGTHGDKYYACVQCSTRYLTREALAGHMNENHADRNLQIQEKTKEPSSSPCKELGNQSPRDRPDPLSPKERRSDESDHEHRAESILLKPMISMKDNFSNPGSPEFDSSFYSSVSCNIRENLLHHLDGKLQSSSSAIATTSLIVDSKLQLQQQQTYYEHSANQIQFPIDISLTAATPVYSKDYANEEYENNSEYAQKPGKRNRSHPRRVSFEKYNFPRKYDGKEQWTCSIKDLSKFDISTQLSLRKKQQLLKERYTLSRLHQISLMSPSGTTDIAQDEQDLELSSPEESKSVEEASGGKKEKLIESMVEGTEAMSPRSTEFSSEFENFLRLRKWDEKTSNEAAKKQEVVYAELTGEWSRPRIYICGACATRHVTLKEMEDHKAISHPNVWCSHFEFSGDQRELYKHLFLPGKNIPTAKARAAMLAEKVCTKCSKNCTTLSELHRHMLECGGDQAWLLGLFGNGKKKCKWRPFGSRSRRRRQRGMKRNIQNSQTPRVNTPKEKQPTGPRVRPSDRESIQKMLANLPPKRATRKVLQDSTMRTQGRLRNVQTRTRPRMVGDNSTASRMSRNKAVLRNKLLKNAKSIQRNRCRIDNISAVIESVVRNYHPDKTSDDDKDAVDGYIDKETKEKSIDELNAELVNEKSNRTKVGRGPRVLGKRRNVRTKDGATRGLDQPRKGNLKARARGMLKNPLDPKAEGSSESLKAPKGVRVSPKNVEKEAEVIGPEASPVEAKSPNFLSKNKSSTQTTPKRKRPVDPVASLNASIKAKSQLRTQDGKFAKNPNKDPFSPVKSSENKSPVFGRQLSKERINEISPETSVTRSKLRTVSRNRNNDQPPKRTTRLSSDSDKMPTLEPVVQILTNSEDYTEATNDLPILSPVTPSSSLEKASRGKNLIGKVGARKTMEGENTEAGEAVQVEERDHKQRGRRAKSDLRNLEKNMTGKGEGGKVKEKLKRKSAPARMLNVEEKKTVKNIEETSLKKELKQKKEEGTRTLDTRSNWKTRTFDEEPIKLENVPFEVKKLIGADNKDDLMNKLVLTSLTSTSKRCLRQSMTRVKFGQTRCKIRKDTEMEKKADSGSMSDASTKKEKFEARRKSLRNTERKFERSRTVKEEKFDQANKICEAVNEVKASIRGRRSSSLSNDSKSTMNTGQVYPSDKAEESTVQNSDRRQTRGSLMNSSEEQNDVGEVSQKKIASTGKRRGRVRTIIEVSEKNNVEADKNSTEPTDKSCPIDQNEAKLREESIVKDKQKDEDKEPLKCPDVSETNKINTNRLQVETSSSVDSGKENTLETPAPVQKLKVGRPRKSWGAKRERTSKRSLNNVIGILTEGMNIPAETQQSVPLAPQPAVDIASPEEISGSSIQQASDDSKPVNEDKSEKDSQKQITERAGTPVQNPEEESCQPKASETSEEDTSVENCKEDSSENSKPSKSTKEELPTDDIILDLSRRKQKGKGSFLEKIVSKIAKQKDALLEGEVGSLLDTAADELTSILDEVGPSLSEIAENSVEKNTRTEAEQNVQGSDEHSTCRNLENKDTKAEGEEKALETSATLKQSKEEKENNEGNIDRETSVDKKPSDDQLRPEEKNTESSPDTSKEVINSKEIEPQITPEEECKVEIFKEDPNKDTKISLKPEESEKLSVSDQQSSNEKVSKIHKHPNKEGHRRPRGRKPAVKNKTVDLINDSEESEEEDKTELQNKSKIVKSVFGRVFGSEKTEKVKESLNDWVSKSEEDSDLSRANFVSTSSNVTNAEATSEARNEDKNLKKHSVTPSVPSTTRKKPGRKPKDSSSSDKISQEFSSSYFVPVPPNKSRHCKKIAEERIFRSFFLGIEQKKTNYGLRNQNKSDLSIKDSDYGSFSNDEDFCKMVSLEDTLQEEADPKSRDAKTEDEAMSSEGLSKEFCNEKSSHKELAEESNSKQEIGPSQLNPEYEENAFFKEQKESTICDAEIGKEFSCPEPSPVSNEAQLLTVQNISEEKKNQEAVSEETKIKRKSKKRSLEGNSPKKNKRKSVEPVDNSEENLIPDELDLADIMELIDKSKQVPSTKDNFEDDLFVEERIQCGKRKTISEDRVSKNSDSKMSQDTRVAEESTEIAKKLKVDSEEKAPDKKDETEVERNSIEDSETARDEDNSSLLLKISGKRKSYVASADHCQIPESPVKSSSKRRSIHDEKSSESSKEDALSRLESVEGTESAGSEITSEIINEEQIESSSIINNNVEECQSSVNETLDITERSEIREEKPALENAENQQQSKEDLIKNLPETKPTEPVKSPITVKVLKKRGRKKKNPVDIQTKVINQENSQLPPVNVDQVPRRSLRTSRFNEDPEERNKISNDAIKSQTASPSLEQFKVPEVTEVLQLTKKRTYKRRSTTDEHLDGQNSSPSVESEMSSAKYSETKSLNEKEEQPSVHQKDFLENKQCSSKGSHQLGLERSSSSGSIDLSQTNRRRSSKRKQLSSEDLSGQKNLNLRAESVDNLSETSCTSESSYFRKKRFTKRKKEFQERREDVQTDTSITDPESMDSEKPADRRQSLRRRAKENISFEYSAFDLVDYFGIPMDMEDSPQEDTVENSVNQEPDSTTEELIQEPTANNISNQEPEEISTSEDKSTEDTRKSEVEEEDDSKGEEKADDKLEELPQSQDDFQTPKKRAAGNFVVVHKKTGEILIVEKRKKLTKEAARFFCDVCATSFTRKSSLKKHNQSQSHLVQVTKFRKDKTLMECKENLEDTCSIGQNDVSSDENRSTTDDVKKDQKENFLDSLYDQTDLKSVEDESSSYTGPADQEFLMDSHQRILEDELLDEEICKITENMSHDEYVLTDHVSPGPESTSTPIKVEIKKTEEVGKKKKHERKKEKAKKKNLSNEQVTLDSSETEGPIDSSMMNLLDTSMSMETSKLSDSDSEYSFLLANSLACTLNKFREKYLQNAGRTEESQDGKDLTELKKDLEQQERTGYSESNLDGKAENLNGKDVPKENHSTERLSLKLIINKRSLENFKEQDTPLDRLDTLAKENEEKPEDPLDSFGDPIKEINQLEPEIDQLNLDMYLGSSKQVENRKSTENIEDFDTFKVQSLGEDLADRQNSMVIENEMQNESVKETRHGKSKKGKGRKHQEEIESSDDTRRTSKSKDNQSNQISEGTNGQKSTDNSKTLEYNDENPELLLYDSQLESTGIKVNNVISPSKVEAKNEEESDELKTIEDQDSRKVQHELNSLEKVVLRHSTEEEQLNQETIDSKNKNSSFNSLDEDEDSSSSSLADKPLSQLLLRTNLKVDTGKKLLIDSDDELRPEEKNAEDSPDTNTSTDNQECNDKEVSNSEQMEPQVSSEEECEGEIPKMETEDTKTLLEPENEVPSSKDVDDKESDDMDEDNNQKSSHGSNEKVSKTHKHSSKEGHRRSKGKKAPARSKIADLTSDSEGSEDEDKTELQNKSKIVKSVFGRVFGGEKADKVKEVLNDWVSKSEDDSDASRSDFRSTTPNELNAEETLEARNEEKRHLVTSVSSTIKKKPGRKPKDSSSIDRTKEKNPLSENREELRGNRHSKSRNSSGNRKKSEEEASDYYFLVLPPNKSRHSKKIAEERISRAFDGVRMFEEFLGGDQKEGNYGLRSQSKPDLTIKDSGYGSFNYDEDSSKMVCSEEPLEEEQKLLKKRKSLSSKTSKSKTDSDDWKDLVMEMRSLKSSKEPTDEEDNSVKDIPEQEPLSSRLSADLKSRSCSSLAPSSVRNRSPSMDRNSQSTRDTDVDEEDEDIGRGRISPLFVRETPGSSIESSSNSENEEDDENVLGNESTVRKRSSSEFSGEKIVIRSPSSTHKGEVVTIAPTDAIEDNALDVPQEIETAKPRQGKVLNFDEELFVECCSRLKATTENELRGAKKIKLDHNEGYHRKDEQQQGLRGPRDRWRDVESQNSLGSLLESVNQLLGEEMYSTRERDYPKRAGRNLRSEHSSRSASPDMSRADNLGYEDSLDVAFEHNNKLRDKIQQRMRESENLIASTFGKSSNDIAHHNKNNEQDLRNSYSHLQDQGQVSGASLSNRSYSDAVHIRNLQEQQNAAKMHLDSGFKNKMNSSLGGLLDKALSNLLHSNGKHDHNGSTPMKVLAELACARAPTSTTGLPISQELVQPAKTSPNKESIPDPCPVTVPKDIQKKPRNPIKELFERKKEMNERKQQEKSKTEAALRELNVHRQRKTKKMKKHQDFPLIRRGEHGGGLGERKKRRDGFERKEEFVSDRIKDVYDFDEEESQIEPNLGSVMSYRSRPGYEVSCLRTKEVDVAGLMSKAIGESLENGKAGDALSSRLESMIDRKFKELEKFAPKTKGALKSFQSEDQRQITGPMDEFVERKQLKSKRPVEQSLKHSKLKKRNKNPKKKTRNAWYENDSSDEYRTTAVKPEDIGVGISKSQRTCSKGKQNIFAELYTSSESEFEHDGVNYESKKQRRAKKGAKKVAESEDLKQNQESVNKYSSENEDRENDDWRDQDLKDDVKHESDHKKSESEMSDHPLVIDERKDGEDQRNSDEETETQYERNYEMDDLYREDSSIVDSDVEDSVTTEAQNVPDESRVKNSNSLQEKINGKTNCIRDELIPLEEALDMLDQADNEASEANYNVDRNVNSLEDGDPVITAEPDISETFNPVEESAVKSPSLLEEQDQELEQEEEPDNDLLSLPEKLSSNEKPQKESDNLPLHVFLSRKVQESKKRKEQQLKKMQEEQERILMDFQPTRRQRKCAIGKQGLLAEISSSDEEISPRDRRSNDKSDHDKPRKQKRESKEKRKERYIEKKHEQMIAKEQKAIEEEILREVGKKKDSLAMNPQNCKSDLSDAHDPEKLESMEDKIDQEVMQKKKHQAKEKQKKQSKVDEEINVKHNNEGLDDPEGNCNKSILAESNHEDTNNQESPVKQKRHSKSPTKPKRTSKGDAKVASKRNRNANSDKSRNRADSKGSRDKERRSSNGKHDSDDEELKTTKSWNKVEEGVGVAIGRRKRAAANQLYYWSSSSDEEEMLEVVPVVEEEEDDRQEQHGWIVGDSHKRMITMLAMEKQLKEKRRRSEDEFEPGRAKSKKHRNSTS